MKLYLQYDNPDIKGEYKIIYIEPSHLTMKGFFSVFSWKNGILIVIDEKTTIKLTFHSDEFYTAKVTQIL